jgi:hypothetical protein
MADAHRAGASLGGENDRVRLPWQMQFGTTRKNRHRTRALCAVPMTPTQLLDATSSVSDMRAIAFRQFLPGNLAK